MLSTDTRSGAVSFLLFPVAHLLCALPAEVVVRVVPFRAPFPTLNPDPVRIGNLLLDGEMISLVDVRARFGLPRLAPHAGAVVLVVGTPPLVFGLVVDGLAGGEEASASGPLLPLPANLQADRACFRGVVATPRRPLLLHLGHVLRSSTIPG